MKVQSYQCSYNFTYAYWSGQMIKNTSQKKTTTNCGGNDLTGESTPQWHYDKKRNTTSFVKIRFNAGLLHWSALIVQEYKGDFTVHGKLKIDTWLYTTCFHMLMFADICLSVAVCAGWDWDGPLNRCHHLHCVKYMNEAKWTANSVW